MSAIAHIPNILRNHAEGAAFLWTRRAAFMHDPTIGEVELGRVDRRLIAHLAGLNASGDQSLVELQARFDDFPEAGEAFAYLATAIAVGETAAAESFLEVANELPKCWPGLSGAVGWSTLDDLKPFVRDWVRSPLAVARFLAVAAHSHCRVDPGDRLDDVLSDTDSRVRARGLRLLGEIGDVSRTDRLLAAVRDGSADEQFFASRSALLLGRRGDALDAVRQRALEAHRTGDAALELAVLADHGEDGRKWLGQLTQNKARKEAAVEICGAIDAEDVRKWLFRCASDPDLSAAAGRAMRTMYDIDFDDTDAFEADGETLGPKFAERTDGPWPVASRVKAALENGATGPRFECLPRLRRRCLSQAMATPGRPLAEWRSRRAYPAWS